jgi:hypothetical protein
MRQKSLSVCGLVIATLLACVPSARAQTVAAGPYYATPSWDQTIACTSTANCPRFIVLSNFSSAAVLDRETGLVWEQSPDTTGRSWPFAQFDCNNKVVGNRKGWRLPTNQELASLIDPTVPGLALPAGHPFSNVLGIPYWSATTDAFSASNAWIVVLDDGRVTTSDKSNTRLIWCVRGGQGVDAQ